MSPVVGYATLQVIPSMKGVHDTIRRELARAGQAGGSAAGDAAGRGLTSALGAASQKAAQAAFRGLETAAAAAGVTIGASLVKGYGRLTTIQDASSALTISLGDSASAAALLADTLDVVKGTPFSLDQFAAGAQRMAGMNIEAAKIPAYLEAIGEASATQGKRADEFAQRLMQVFGQVSAAGQVQLVDVWRISDTGVNALGILANSFGMTRDAMKKMISEGALPADQALDALARGILEGTDGPAGATVALAGTMEALRENLSGAVGGMEAASARFGASLLEPFSPALVAGANAAADVFDLVGKRAGDMLGRFADGDAMERFVDLVEDAPQKVQGLIDSLGDLGPLAGGAASALGALATGGLTRMIGPLGMLIPGGGLIGSPLGALAAGLVGIAAASPAARDALGEVGDQLGPVLGRLGDELGPVVLDVADALEDVLPAAVRAGGAALIALVDAGADVVGALGPIATSLLELGTPAVTAGLETTADLLEEHGDLLVYAAGGWAALRVAAIAGSAASAVSGLIATGGALEGVALRATYAAQGIGQVAVGLVTLPAAANLSTLQTGFANLRTSITGVASSAAVASVAVAGIGIGLAAVYMAGQRSEQQAEAWRDALEANLDTSSVESYAEAIEAAAAQQRNMKNFLIDEGAGTGADAAGFFDRLGASSKNALQLLTPMENTLSDADAMMKQAGETARDLSLQLAVLEGTYAGIGDAVGLSAESVERWAQKLDIDATQRPRELAEAIEEATTLADTGNPNIEALADSFEILGDETSSAKDMLDAFKDTLDSLIGSKVGLEQTSIGWQEALQDLAGSVTGPQAEITAGLSDTVAGIDEDLADRLGDLDTEENRARRDLEGDELSSRLTDIADQRADAYADAANRRAEAEEEAAGKAAEALGEWSTNLEGVDEASLNTRDVVSGLAEQAIDMAVAFAESGGGIDGATWKLAEAREQIIASGEAAGISRESMEAYLDELGLTPENITTAIEAQTDPDAMGTAERALNVLARERAAPLLAELDPVSRATAERYIGQLAAPQTVRILFEMSARDRAIAERYMGQAAHELDNAAGGIYEFAEGGISPAHIALGTRFKWAEPETGGEAFIPRLGDRARSVELLQKVGKDWFGLQVIDPAAVMAMGMGGIHEDQPGWNWRTMGNGRAGADIARRFPNGLLGDLDQSGRLEPGEWDQWRNGGTSDDTGVGMARTRVASSDTRTATSDGNDQLTASIIRGLRMAPLKLVLPDGREVWASVASTASSERGSRMTQAGVS